jgi:hypothetical protein
MIPPDRRQIQRAIELLLLAALLLATASMRDWLAMPSPGGW